MRVAAGLFRMIFSTFCRRVIISTLLEVMGAVVERFARDSVAKRNAPTSPSTSPKGRKTIRVKNATDLVQINVHVSSLMTVLYPIDCVCHH